MKKIVALILALIPSLSGISQISITSSDMPSVGDTFRVSNGLITPAIDPVPTGPSHTWDFSTLEWISQDVDSFISVASTGPIYSIVFANVPFNPYRANLAAHGPDLPAIPQVNISDVNYFYYNSSSAYEVSGYGALINGISAPIPFNNKDRIYDFPVDYGNLDSSDSDFQISLPGLGYYGREQHRVNEADGWGTLITPYGTFDALRVKSVITSRDTLYLDTLGFGFGFSLPQTVEYKWLGDQQGIPLLQINTSVTLGTEVVTSIRYRDSLRTLTGLIETVTNDDLPASLFPNPAFEKLTVILDRVEGGKTEITLTGIDGRSITTLWSGDLAAGTHQLGIDLKANRIANGYYLVRVQCGNQSRYLPLVISGQ